MGEVVTNMGKGKRKRGEGGSQKELAVLVSGHVRFCYQHILQHW